MSDLVRGCSSPDACPSFNFRPLQLNALFSGTSPSVRLSHHWDKGSFSILVMFVSSVRIWFHYDPIQIEPMVLNVDLEIMTSESKGTFRPWRGLQLAPRPTLDVFLFSGKSRQEIL